VSKEQKIILTKIKRACLAFPENSLAGYIVSLIEGQPNEDFVKAWKASEVKYERAFKALKEEKEVPTETTTGTEDGTGLSSGHDNSNEGVVHEPDSDTGHTELGHDGRGVHGSDGRKLRGTNTRRKTKRTTTKDVKGDMDNG